MMTADAGTPARSGTPGRGGHGDAGRSLSVPAVGAERNQRRCRRAHGPAPAGLPGLPKGVLGVRDTVLGDAGLPRRGAAAYDKAALKY